MREKYTPSHHIGKLLPVKRYTALFSILSLFASFTVFYDLSAQDAKVVFSENFDNATTLEPWSPYFSSGWFCKSPLNVLETESGKGKVLKVNFPAGSIGSESGLGNYRISLDSAYKELYLSWEYFLPSNFDYGWADGYGGGKFFGGFTGGSMTAIPNTDATDVDGWASILMFQDGYYSTYNYFKGSTYTSGGWPIGDRVTSIVKGQWRRVTIRLKINDGDLYNGLFEVFDNDVLVYKQTNAKIVNAAHPEYYIEHIYLNTFFGGSGAGYVSPITQYMKFDNLVAFYYPKGSSGYRSGASESGRVIQVPQAGSYHPVPPNKFTPTTFTDASGIVNSHCAFYQPVDHHSTFETSTIQVSGASYLTINLTKFDYNAQASAIGSMQILKIYKGTGTTKELVRTYQKDVYTTLGSFTISGNSATIQWQAGQGTHGGFTLTYTSNGSGSGKNFGCGNFFAKQAEMVVPVPAAPSSLTSTSVTSSSVVLKWSDNSTNEAWFEIERRGPNNNNLVTTLKANANTSTFTDAGLPFSSLYTYRIRAYNSTSGYSAYSNSIDVTTLTPPPNAPSSLVVTGTTTNSVSLKWNDNSGIESWYEIERRGPNNDNLVTTLKSNANTTTFTDAGLQHSSLYTYRIRAYNSASGYSAYSNSVSTSTVTPVPTAPSGLVSKNITYKSVLLQWTDNSTNESWFEIERRGPNDNTLVQTIKSSANTTAYSDAGLKGSAVYSYRIRAYNSVSGYSAYSNTIEITTSPVPVPAAPSSLQAEDVSDRSATLTWTDNSDNEAWFEIERSGPGFDDPIRKFQVAANAESYTDTSLQSGSVYAYVIRAYNVVSGYSAYSNTVQFITVTPVPGTPSSLKIVGLTMHSATLQWIDNSDNETWFEVERSGPDDTGLVRSRKYSANSTGFTDDGLLENSVYLYKVRAHNVTSGYSDYSNTVEVATNALLPEAPAALRVKNLGTDFVSLEWDDNSDNESWFEIEQWENNDSSHVRILIADENNTAYTDTGLTANTAYTYRIRAYSVASGYSTYANSLHVVTQKLPPKAPSMLQSKEFTNESITIRWNDNSTDETGFEIIRSSATDETNPVIIRVNANDTVYTDKGLEPSKTYIYTVKAVNDAGASPLSNKNITSTLSLAETKRIKDGLVAYYSFIYDPNHFVYDLSGYGEPLNLEILQPSAIHWDKESKLEILSGTMITSVEPAGKITAALNETGETTFECWIRPNEPFNTGVSRVISIGSDITDIGFVLDQHYERAGDEKSIHYRARFQTESTNGTGDPEIVQQNRIPYISLLHVAYVRESMGNEILYINGEKSTEGFRPGNLDPWDSTFYLRLGNEEDQDYGWTGMIYSVAVYNRALSGDDIAWNFSLGPCDSLKNSIVDLDLKTYPNPAKDKVTIDISPVIAQGFTPLTVIRMLDIYGKVYFEETVFDPNNQFVKTLDIKNYRRGIYFLQVISGNNLKASKIVIQ